MSYEEIKPFIVVMKNAVEKIDSTLNKDPNRKNYRHIAEASLSIRIMLNRVESVLKRE